MPIDRFRALGGVLSQVRDEICRLHQITPVEAFKRTERFINENSQQWRLETPNINYADPFCRIAYLYMNVSVHSRLLELAFEGFEPLKALVQAKAAAGDELRVCALGGGPGSELLGLVR